MDFLRYILLLYNIIILVLTHRYGRDGRDTKKYEDKCLLFDIEHFKHMTDKKFTDHYNTCLKEFIDLLNEDTKSDFSMFSTISDVRTFPVARLKTSDPSVKIMLSFEVQLHLSSTIYLSIYLSIYLTI